MEFEDKVAVVTGGARGIGAACADALAAEGARVALLDLALDDAELSPARIALACDVSDASSVARAFAAVRERFGRIDVLVNNAGIGHAGRTGGLEEDAWDRVIDIVLKGTLLCSQQAGRTMIEQGSGAIVNVASMMGHDVLPQPRRVLQRQGRRDRPDQGHGQRVGAVRRARQRRAPARPHGDIEDADRLRRVRAGADRAVDAARAHGPPDEVAAAVRYLALRRGGVRDRP